MSKGRDPTKKKWRNGQRQKGSHFGYYYLHGHKNKHKDKYPRNGKFMTEFEGTKLGMRVPYHFNRAFHSCILFYLRH